MQPSCIVGKILAVKVFECLLRAKILRMLEYLSFEGYGPSMSTGMWNMSDRTQGTDDLL
jgi:hypothetical protein